MTDRAESAEVTPQNEWRPISADYKPGGFRYGGKFNVLFARKTADGWEYKHEQVDTEDVEGLGVMES